MSIPQNIINTIPAGATAAQAAAILKQAGYGANDVAGFMKDTYHQTANQTAAVFKLVGFDVVASGNALKQFYGLDQDTMQVALQQAGYTASEVSGFITSIWHRIPIPPILNPRHW